MRKMTVTTTRMRLTMVAMMLMMPTIQTKHPATNTKKRKKKGANKSRAGESGKHILPFKGFLAIDDEVHILSTSSSQPKLDL